MLKDIDTEVKQLNCKMRAVSFRRLYVGVKTDFYHVDFCKYFVP